MKQDPIVREVRQVREEIFSRWSHDPEEFFNHLRDYQKKYEDRLVTRQPCPALKQKIA